MLELQKKDPQIIQQNKILMGSQTINLRARQMVYALAAMMDKDDPEEIIDINANEFLNWINESSENKWSNIYHLTSEIFQNLNNNPILIKKRRGKDFIRINWLSSLSVEDGRIRARFSKDIAHYLLYKQGLPYTKILYDLRQYSSTYTARILDLFQNRHIKDSGKNEIKFEMSLNELKLFFGVQDKYKLFKNFDRRILQTTQKELEDNSQAPYWFEYRKIRKGRSIGAIEFIIYVRPKILLQLVPNLRRFGTAQISMFEGQGVELTNTGKAILHDLKELRIKEELALRIMSGLTFSQAKAYCKLVSYGVNRNLAFTLVYDHCRLAHISEYEDAYVAFALNKIEKDRIRRIVESKNGGKKKTTPDNKKGGLVKLPIQEQRYLPEFMDVLVRDHDKEPDEPLFIKQ